MNLQGVLISILLLTLISKASKANESTHPCNLALSSTPEILHQLGYDAHLSSRLISSRPDIVKSVIARALAADSTAKSVTVFRGLSVEPKNFKASWAEASLIRDAEYLAMGNIWVSRDVKIATSYSLIMTPASRSQKLRTIVEYEIPNYMLLNDVGGEINMGQPIGVVLSSEIPDSRPFIKRIGVLDVSKFVESKDPAPLSAEDIRWSSYKEIFKNGIPENP